MNDDELIAGLRTRAARNGDRIQAATELLILEDHWLWDAEFARRCVYDDGGLPAVSFTEAGRYHDEHPAGSDGQLAMLRVAADIGSGRWALETMDGRNRLRVAAAVELAAGIR